MQATTPELGPVGFWSPKSSSFSGSDSIVVEATPSVCRMSVVCQINCVGGITWPTRMLKVFWGRLNQ